MAWLKPALLLTFAALAVAEFSPALGAQQTKRQATTLPPAVYCQRYCFRAMPVASYDQWEKCVAACTWNLERK
jgi:hypothetical protein